jgi:DNA-directed RNA polymerase specialized sigma24 family protein
MSEPPPSENSRRLMAAIDALPADHRQLIYDYGVKGYEEAAARCPSVARARAYLEQRRRQRQEDLLR